MTGVGRQLRPRNRVPLNYKQRNCPSLSYPYLINLHHHQSSPCQQVFSQLIDHLRKSSSFVSGRSLSRVHAKLLRAKTADCRAISSHHSSGTNNLYLHVNSCCNQLKFALSKQVPIDCLDMMMSTSLASHHSVDETPTWDDIANSLKCLLGDLELDFSRLGTKSRMQYEDFEVIFAHLFTMIDPKRRLRSFRAARNADERKSFIEMAVKFINDHQLCPQRVSSSQLHMFGGEPFRRVLGSLIRVATDRYDQIADGIPMIELKPIEKSQSGVDSKAKLGDILEVLKAYPDARYDGWVIEEVTRKHFS